MHVKHVKLVNAGPFTSFSTDLSHGTVGVFGRNGSGKTSLMRFMHAALTRRFDMFPGIKADLPMSSAPARSPSYVELHASHAGVDFEITLSLRDRKSGEGYSRLKVAGEKELTAEPDIAVRLAQFGITPPVTNFSVFVYNVYGFIDLTPSKRAEVYRTLCGTEKASQAFKLISEMLSGNALAAADFVDNSDAVAEELASAEASLRTAVARRDLIQERLGKPVFAKAARFLKLAQRRLQLEARLVNLRDALSASQRRQASAERKAGELGVRLAGVKQRQKEAQQAATQATRKLAEAEAAAREWRRRERLEQEVQALSKSAAPPARPSTRESIETLTAWIAVQEQRCLDIAGRIKLLELEHDGACPTCGQSLEHYDAAERNRRVAAEKVELRKTEEALESLRSSLVLVADYARRRDKHAAAENARRAKLEAAQAELSACGRAAPPIDVAEQRRILARSSKFEERCEQLRDEARDACERVTRWRTRADSLARKIRRIESAPVLRRDNPAPELLEKARRLLDYETRLKERSQRIVGRIDVLRRSVLTRRRELSRLRQLATQTQQKRRLRAIYERAAELLHWDGLPRKVASKTLARVSTLVNEVLEQMGRPFAVEASDAMSFNVTIGDAPARDMVWLSSGQRVMLAVAFWSAAAVFATSPGLLFLDEPTANLDSANVDYLGAALARLSGGCRGSRQIIMTTHADGLRASFDQVVELY